MEMTLEDVKNMKPYWNAQIANFKKNNSREPVFTLLQMAIFLNKREIVEYLLARRNVDINALSKNNQTALMVACQRRVPLDWVEAILKKGGDIGINLTDNNQETALDKCVYNSRVYHLLLSYGAVENKNIMRMKQPLVKPKKYSDSLWLNVCGCGTRCYK